MTSVKSEDYQTLNSELKILTESLQNGDLDVDEATKAYEKAMQIIQKLENYLTNAENKVKKIKANFEG